MSFALRASASAERLVAHFAHATTLTLKSLSASALTADRDTTVTVTSATVRCTVPTPFAQRLRDGARVLDGDLRVTVWADDPALTFDPEPDQVAELDGDSYRVVAVERLAGAFELQLRGGGV